MPANLSAKDVISAMDGFILSVSGWRKVFAKSGDENDVTDRIRAEDMVLAFCAGRVFADFFAKRTEGGRFVVLGRDTRPTGAELARCIMAAFEAEGTDCAYLGIAAAPEIMALSASDSSVAGFVYISASHNPPGHNGIKAGADGGVMGAKEAKKLISAFKDMVISLDDKQVADILDKLSSCTVAEDATLKTKAYKSYLDFISSVICGGSYNRDTAASFSAIREGLAGSPITVVGELNGSSRSLSIDRDFIEGLGCRVLIYNNVPGDFAHDILPEGESLQLCAELAEEAAKEGGQDVLGYVPDCDGDRGNIVFAAKEGSVRVLEAQEVFALAVLGELTFAHAVNPGKPLAVVVNGPTSIRIEEIAEAFSAEVVRVEVGEAHVTGKADELIKSGYVVPILGEGSNGGSIVPPSKVRDPLATLGSVLKLLALRQEPYSLFKKWCEIRNIQYKEDFSLSDVLNSLPAYCTSATGDEGASLRVRTRDMAELKRRYQDIFVSDWQKRKQNLTDMGISSYHKECYIAGERHIESSLPFSAPLAEGGFKFVLKDKENRPIAFMWMRKSGTEPVFRILVDAKGSNRKLAEYLFSWQRSLIDRADRG